MLLANNKFNLFLLQMRFSEGNRCKPPKMRKKFGLTHVIRPGEAIRSHDVPMDDAISEYYDDNDQYRCETRTRSLQPHSTVDVTDNNGTSRHPQSNSESSRKSLRTKETVNYGMYQYMTQNERQSILFRVVPLTHIYLLSLVILY